MVSEQVRETIIDIAQRRMTPIYAEKPKESVTVFLIELVAEMRLYLHSSQEQVSLLWDKIREDEDVFDFVVKSTLELSMRCDMIALTRTVSASYCSLRQVHSAVDDDVLNELPATDSYDKILKANPWLVFLILLETTPFFEMENTDA